jgi:catechol 2,3-dioxygenase-like lactoylglutathione lyase family enzyme
MARKNSVPNSSNIHLSVLDRVIFFVRDIERSARWYVQTLGLVVRYQEPGWVEFETKGVTLCLHGGREGGRVKDPTTVGFRVEDFDATYRALRLREVPGLTEPLSPCAGVRCFSFEDPDGNVVGIEGR